MRFRTGLLAFFVTLMLGQAAAKAQQTIEAKTQTIKDALVVLCLAGGSETVITAQGDLELRSKIKDILSGNIGASAGARSAFSKQVWEGIIGGISKEMTAVQSQQASEARKCMVDNGFILINRVLSAQ
jgi:hypothetical protein